MAKSKMIFAALLLLCLFPSCKSNSSGGSGTNTLPPAVDVTGAWSGSYYSSVFGSQLTTMNLLQSGASVTGGYSSATGATGNVSGTVSDKSISFTMTVTTAGCSGTFHGSATITDNVTPNKLDFTYSGSSTCGGNESGTGSLLKITFSSPAWIFATIDNQCTLGGTSMAVDSNNNVHIAYADQLSGQLKYATNVSGSWTTYTIDKTSYYISLALDSNNNVHISYYDPINHDLKYATNVSGSFQSEIVDSNGDAGVFNSLGVDHNGKVHISYYSYLNFGNVPLMYATNASGVWNTSVIESTPYTQGETSLAIDSANAVHVAYILTTYISKLKYATNSSGTWTTEFVEPGTDDEFYPSLAVDSNDKAHISYRGNGNLNYATNASGAWVISQLDLPAWYTSLAIDSNNNIHISYNSQYENNNLNYNNLKYATNQSGYWVTSTVEALDGGNVGMANAIVTGPNNTVHICYYDSTHGSLKYAKSK